MSRFLGRDIQATGGSGESACQIPLGGKEIKSARDESGFVTE
jgi:hypothetical protein